MMMVLHFRGMLKGGHGRGGGKGKLDCPNWQQADDTALLRMVLARRL